MQNVEPVTALLFIASGGCAVVGNFLLKAGINRLGKFSYDLVHWQSALLSMGTNWQIIVGFFLYAMSSVLYLKLLTTIEVTRIYPALVAYMSVILLILGVVVLRESFTVGKVLGTALVILGIFFISK